MITAILDKIDEKKTTASETYIIEELTENLFIFISELIGELKEHTSWDITLANITDYTKCKVSDYPGLTTRIKFKFMDMMDIVKKN
jgi:transposase